MRMPLVAAPPTEGADPLAYDDLMTVPALRTASTPALEILADVLVVGVAGGEDGVRLVGVGEGFESLADSLASIGLTGAKDEVRRIPASVGAARAIALVGLGTGEIGPDALRYAAGTVTRLVRGIDSIAFALPIASEEDLLAVLEGAALGAYSFDEFRSSKPAGKAAAEDLVVLTDLDGGAQVEKAVAIATAVQDVKDLVNTPPSHLYPATFADAAASLSEGLPVEVTVLDEDALKEQGFGGIMGVGQGSTRGPRLVKVAYSPDESAPHLALVGKGITFDSGGLSLKPGASMVGMKYDMTGAATVLAVVLAAARLGLPLRLTAWLCLAENMPSGSAIRPNDVLTIRGGQTVEVLNTDAEGRLVLADGIVAAGEEQPDAIVDIATLTGAASVALGTRYSGVMGDGALSASVVAAGVRVGEPLWHMPLPQELRALLDSDVADIANVKIGNTAGGMLIAGVFLRDFVGTAADGTRIPWAHIDIAASANNAGVGFGHVAKGPTGVAVRTLLALAEDFSGK
jgi:leucyl aminopeptidase